MEQGAVVYSERLCSLGRPWFDNLADFQRPAATLYGRPVALDEAIVAAVQILSAAKAPLVYGLSRSSTAGQRAAVRLADRIGATIDTTASTCHAPSIMAVQSVGESTCSLGEVRNRSDLVIYWGSNPLKSHPRHMERCVDAVGMFVPEGRMSRQVVVVDVEATNTSALSDYFIQVQPDGDFELIWALRAELQQTDWEGDSAGGVPRAQVVELAAVLKNCRYGAIFFGLGVTHGSTPHATVEALLQLVTELNAHTRFIARRMRIPGDVSGADSVLCWQTGFPFSVNLARGFPRYNPSEYSADQLLTRCEVDAAVLVGSEGVAKLSTAAQRRLAEIEVVVLDNPGETYSLPVAVAFTTAIYGLHRAGTAYRMDEVPIPLRAVAHSPYPSDDEVLRAICEALTVTDAAGVGLGRYIGN